MKKMKGNARKEFSENNLFRSVITSEVPDVLFSSRSNEKCLSELIFRKVSLVI